MFIYKARLRGGGSDSHCEEATQVSSHHPRHHPRRTMRNPLNKVRSIGRLRLTRRHAQPSTGSIGSGTLTTALETLTASFRTESDNDPISTISMSNAGDQGDKQGAIACLCKADVHGDAIYVVIGTLDGGWKKLSEMKTLLEDMHKDLSDSAVLISRIQDAEKDSSEDIAEIAAGTGETGSLMLADDCWANLAFISALLQFTDGTRILTTKHNVVRLAYHLAWAARHEEPNYEMTTLRAGNGFMELSMLLFLGAEAQPVDVGLLSARNGRDVSLRTQLEAYAKGMT